MIIADDRIMKKYIHINQHLIRSNNKDGTNKPVITVKTYKNNEYGHELYIDGPCKIVYRPEKPLSCGAKVWCETTADVKIYTIDDINNACNSRSG
jgi:hypothetical protein